MLTYDTDTALIVVDMQNDFADPGGSLFVSEGDMIVGPINLEIIRAASAGAFVVYTQDWHPPDTPHFEKDGGIWPVHCVAGSWGAEFHPRLVVAGPTVRKGTDGEDGYSGFTMRDPVSGSTSSTQMAGFLQEQAVMSTVVIGLALDYCVGATARDSAAGGLDTTVSLRHTAAVNLNPGDGNGMVAMLEQAEVSIR